MIFNVVGGGSVMPGFKESAEHPGCFYRMVDGVQEWLNPPLMLGVEYRTTKRYLGRVVYAMLFKFGNLPNSSTASVTIPSTANVYYAVAAHLLATSGLYLNFIDSFTETKVWVKTPSDYSNTTANVIIEYTKN